MHRTITRTTLVVLALLLTTATSASATRLLVGGTIRSTYFQRLVNGYARHMPTPNEVVDLYIGTMPGPACPGSVPNAPNLEVAACAMPPQTNADGRPAVRIMPIMFKPENLEDIPQTFAHEIGHLELDYLTPAGGILNDADRSAFDTIWHRPPGLGWWDPIHASCELDLGPNPQYGETCGEQSAAGEWAADAYALCATGHWRLDYDHIDTGNLPDFGYIPDVVSNMRKRRAPILASCGLFRRAAARPTG